MNPTSQYIQIPIFKIIVVIQINTKKKKKPTVTEFAEISIRNGQSLWYKTGPYLSIYFIDSKALETQAATEGQVRMHQAILLVGERVSTTSVIFC